MKQLPIQIMKQKGGYPFLFHGALRNSRGTRAKFKGEVKIFRN